MWTKISRFYPPWLDIIPLLLIAGAFCYTNYHYASFPARIPTHFGFNGLPDAWSSKDYWSTYLLLLIGTPIWISMTLMNYFLLIKPENPGRYINISKRDKERLGPGRLEAIRTTTARGILLINLTMITMIVVLQYGLVNTALGWQKGMGYVADIFGLALLIESVGLAIKTVSMTSVSKAKR
jgi:uncharacterized membrane protein